MSEGYQTVLTMNWSQCWNTDLSPKFKEFSSCWINDIFLAQQDLFFNFLFWNESNSISWGVTFQFNLQGIKVKKKKKKSSSFFWKGNRPALINHDTVHFESSRWGSSLTTDFSQAKEQLVYHHHRASSRHLMEWRIMQKEFHRHNPLSSSLS